ncbi:ATP-binding cassette domain-containing protein [Hamadaea tsunoensis]|uniref:ATP-binding cassette domain-containing protein n=1 Tax=Hamadaea tsunoensis TaxID=53368 RepID=UPI00041582F4|nr:ATP-binding cassette domain-containing protein [Hamadaea tsunoensis]
MTDALLQVDAVTYRYGDLVAVDDFTLVVQPGERLALRGASGAGKSTLLDLIDGTVTPAAGRIVFAGQDITAWSADRRAAMGIARVFQKPQSAEWLTVCDNILHGARQHRRQGVHVVRQGAALVNALNANAYDLAAWAGLRDLADVLAGELSYGQRRRLDLAMAMAVEPMLLLLDEPTAGLSSEEAGFVGALLRNLPVQIAYLLVENDSVIADRRTSTAVHFNQPPLLRRRRDEPDRPAGGER